MDLLERVRIGIGTSTEADCTLRRWSYMSIAAKAVRYKEVLIITTSIYTQELTPTNSTLTATAI
jgi:hypothetical protein